MPRHDFVFSCMLWSLWVNGGKLLIFNFLDACEMYVELEVKIVFYATKVNTAFDAWQSLPVFELLGIELNLTQSNVVTIRLSVYAAHRRSDADAAAA